MTNEEWAYLFGSRVRKLRHESGLSQYDFYKMAGLSSQAAVARLEVGRLGSITFKTLYSLIYLAIKQGWLVGELFIETDPLKYVQDERLMRELQGRLGAKVLAKAGISIQELSEENPEGMRSHVAKESDDSLNKMTSTSRKSKGVYGYKTVPAEAVPSKKDWWKEFVPIVGRVAAGAGIGLLEENSDPPSWCGEYLVHSGAPKGAVAVRVSGESMLPDFRDGDMLIVDTQSQDESGVCCILLSIGGEREALVKEIKRKGKKVMLLSKNPAFPPREVSASSIESSYKIVCRLPRSTKVQDAK